MNSDCTPFDSFHLFSKLPPELRLRIWDLTLPTTRLVPIRCGSDLDSPASSGRADHGHDYHRHHTATTTTNTTTTGKKPSWGCTSIAPVPISLHVCAESRAYALSRYQLSFAFARQPGQVFFRPDTDILYFGPRPGYMAANAQLHTFLSLTDPVQLARVRRIAVDDALFWTHTHHYHGCSYGDSSAQYWSLLAVSLTIEALRQIRRRMPALEEIIFVPHAAHWAENPTDVRETLSDQVETAIRDLGAQDCGEDEQWTGSPRWSVLHCPLSFPPPRCAAGMANGGVVVVAPPVSHPPELLV